MNIIYFMLPIALCLGFGFLIAFIRTVWGGQYDDLVTPAYRMLIDEEVVSQKKEKAQNAGQ